MILISLHMLQRSQPLPPRCCFTVSSTPSRLDRDGRAEPASRLHPRSPALRSACGRRCRSEGSV